MRDAIADWFFFDDAERALVADALAWLAHAAPAQESALGGNLARLGALAGVIRDSAPIATSWQQMRGRSDPGEALVDLLCRVPEYDFDLHIPTKAVLGQSYLVAKINFLKAVGYALAAADAPSALRGRAEHELGQSIYSKMVEELFVTLVTNPTHEHALKARAAGLLFRIWDERLLSEADDVAPLLEAAWQARNRVRPVLGTMLGAHEIFRLFQEARDDRFLDYYTGGEAVPDDEMAAFEEFLFGLSHEHIGALRGHLAEHHLSAVSPADALRILGANHDLWSPEITGPQAIYTHYRRRRRDATVRALTGARGPKKTAEEYVLAASLLRDGRS